MRGVNFHTDMERREIQERLCQLQSWGKSSRAKERQDCIGSNSQGPLVEAWQCRRAGGAGGLPGGGDESTGIGKNEKKVWQKEQGTERAKGQRVGMEGV